MEKIIERNYNVPLRKEFQKVPKYKRAKRAIAALKKFLGRHMKSEEIKIGKHLNEKIWDKGIKNPPHHVKVNVFKDGAGVVKAELEGVKYNQPKKEDLAKPEKDDTLIGKLKAKAETKPNEEKKKSKIEAPAKKEVKSEVKEEKTSVKEEVKSDKQVEKEEVKAEEKPVKEKEVKEPAQKEAVEK
tara:strand:+ start:14 stop:568 length:555 start_codon:yes stop_codon:yes gene_type:complete